MDRALGRTNYGRIYGIYTLFHNISMSIGQLFFGYVYDTTDAYYIAYITAIGLYSAAIV